MKILLSSEISLLTVIHLNKRYLFLTARLKAALLKHRLLDPPIPFIAVVGVNSGILAEIVCFCKTWRLTGDYAMYANHVISTAVDVNDAGALPLVAYSEVETF